MEDKSKKERFYKFLQGLDLAPKFEYIFKYKEADIYILREDKLDFSYGGNKLRISIELFKDFFENDYDIMLSYGSLNSNLNRVIASVAKEFGIPCYILTALDEEEYSSVLDKSRKKHLNESLADEAGAIRYFCKKTEVRQSLENIIKDLSAKGDKVYYINKGLDGTGNEEVLEKAYKELFFRIIDYKKFSHIYLAYGTGSTFKGLAKGKALANDKSNLVGISIARDIEFFDDINKLSILSAYKGKSYAGNEEEIYEFINDIYKKTSIPLDPIYTAKAFFGMLNEIDNNSIKGDVLFIHTGGYPIYKEYVLGEFK